MKTIKPTHMPGPCECGKPQVTNRKKKIKRVVLGVGFVGFNGEMDEVSLYKLKKYDEIPWDEEIATIKLNLKTVDDKKVRLIAEIIE